MPRRRPGPTFEAASLREAVELAANLRVTSRRFVAVRPAKTWPAWTVTIVAPEEGRVSALEEDVGRCDRSPRQPLD